MQTFLYAVLGFLAVAAVAMQVWMLVSGIRSHAGGGATFLRALNIVLIVGIAVVVIWALSRG